jgi:hypothetical protein
MHGQGTITCNGGQHIIGKWNRGKNITIMSLGQKNVSIPPLGQKVSAVSKPGEKILNAGKA